MTLEYDCPHCNCTMTIGRDAAGQEVVCPVCRVIQMLPVPLRMTKREARSKLFPYAIFLAIEGSVYLLICGVGILFLVLGFTQLGAKDLLADFLVPLGLWCLALLPGLVLVAAARAMFRAENRVLVVIGIIVGVLLGMCCCLLCMAATGFGMWFQPQSLNDPLLFQALDGPADRKSE